MLRLIDAKRLIKSLEDWNRNDDMDKALYNFAMNRVIEQPTAYDVEAVVKQIEEWNKVTGALPEHSTWYYELISIIERGGVK